MRELDSYPPIAAQQTAAAQQIVAESTLLKRYVGKHTAEAQDAADIYQESVLRVMEQARAKTIHNPVAYAIRIARNLIINRPKVMADDETALQDLVCPSPSPEQALNDQQRLRALKIFLADMPELRRQVLLRRRVKGESRTQIAAALNLSEDAVKKHITRALADLQRFLDQQDNN